MMGWARLSDSRSIADPAARRARAGKGSWHPHQPAERALVARRAYEQNEDLHSAMYCAPPGLSPRCEAAATDIACRLGGPHPEAQSPGHDGCRRHGAAVLGIHVRQLNASGQRLLLRWQLGLNCPESTRRPNQAPKPSPLFPIWPGNGEGFPRFPIRPESGIGKPPFPDSAGSGTRNRGPDCHSLSGRGRKSGNRGTRRVSVSTAGTILSGLDVALSPANAVLASPHLHLSCQEPADGG